MSSPSYEATDDHATDSDPQQRSSALLVEFSETTRPRSGFCEHVKHFRHTLLEIEHSKAFHISVVVLVVLDALIVLAELCIELEMFGKKNHHDDMLETIEDVLHYMSIAILTVFMVEVALKIFAMGATFFHSILEIFDAIVITVSFVLDLVFMRGASQAFGLLIVLRLWRVVRIVNAIILSVHAQAEEKLRHERRLREEAQAQLQQCQEELKEAKERVAQLTQNQTTT